MLNKLVRFPETVGIAALLLLPGLASYAAAATIPLSWDDPMFSTVMDSDVIYIPDGGTVSYKSITMGGGDGEPVASVICNGAATMDHIRINSQEGVRVGGDGAVNIDSSYIEATGVGADHADCIQAYSPGGSGTIHITNSTIRAHDTAATAGLFVADNWTGTITLDNVVFWGGPYGTRIYPDVGGDNYLSFKNVYFVGPFGYGPFIVDADVGGHTNHITCWENVRNATVVNGVLVPGSVIPCPKSDCGTTAGVPANPKNLKGKP